MAGKAECTMLFSVIQQNKYRLLASINTEKLCPEVVQCYPWAFRQHCTTSGHNFSVSTSAPVNICTLGWSVELNVDSESIGTSL